MTGLDRTQVVVAGAGPVGLAATLILARAGIDVTLLEKRSNLNIASKASTFHPPTLEILADLGVIEPMLAEAEMVRRIQYRRPDGPFAEFDMAVLADRTRFPFRLHLEQAKLMPHLLAAIGRHGNARVIFDTEVTGIEQLTGGIRIHTKSASRDVAYEAGYLIGADGAKSAVRDLLGLAFDGAAYPDKILRVMTSDDLDMVMPGLAPITYLFNGAKSMSFLKMPDCWRIIIRVPSDTPEDLAMQDAWLGERIRDVLPSWTRLPTIVNRDVYGASRRIASSNVAGRAYLIGDSAHVTNTRGGMNMNCGIHDAYALCNAMVAGLRAGTSDGIVSAAHERERVAHEMLIPRTDRNVAGGPNWLDKVRDIAAVPAAASAYLATAAMLDMVELAALSPRVPS